MDPDQIAYMVAWANQFDSSLMTKGEVGFGRECVGITRAGSYIDYADWVLSANEPTIWYPEDAYHKHDCLAVLGHGDDALQQLYIWLLWLDENKFIVEDHDTKALSGMNAILQTGTQRIARLTKVGIELGDPLGDIMSRYR